MSDIDELVQKNTEYAASFDKGGLSIAPARPTVVVTCMDARFLPSRIFGLGEGEAHIIRNAGGSAREALRSLVISQRLLGTSEVAIVKQGRNVSCLGAGDSFGEIALLRSIPRTATVRAIQDAEFAIVSAASISVIDAV